MTTDKIQRTDGGPDSYACDNCANVWPFERLEDIADMGERLDAGGVVPAGECPTCGALCYPSEPQPQQQAIQVSTAGFYVVTGRLAHDDEDSLSVIEAATADEAVVAFEAWLREGDDDEEDDSEPRDFYLNYVVECHGEKPKIVRNNAGAGV